MASHVTTTVVPLFGHALAFARCTTCEKEMQVARRGRLPHCPDPSCDGRLVRQRFRIQDPPRPPLATLSEVLAAIGRRPHPASDFDDGGDDRDL